MLNEMLVIVTKQYWSLFPKQDNYLVIKTNCKRASSTNVATNQNLQWLTRYVMMRIF